MSMGNSDHSVLLQRRLMPGRRTVLAAAVAAAIASTAAQAQTQTSSEGLEEIVVTATRRSESQLEVPVSVVAYTQEKMDQQGLRDVSDIAKFTPGVSFQQGDGLRTLNQRISIRGVSSSVGGATTGVYLNDTPIAIRTLRTNGDPNGTAFPRLFDIDRVEVLRGPQGTLFGSGSEGGTVRFLTPEPSLSGSSMYARTGVSTTKYGAPSWEAGVAGGAPIIEDKLGFRASVSTSQTGGVVDHGDYYTGKIDQKDHDGQRSFGIQAAMKWLATDNLTIAPMFYHQQLNADGQGSFYLPDDKRGADVNSPGYQRYYGRYNGQFDNYGHFGSGKKGDYVNANGVLADSAQTMNLYAVNFKYEFEKSELIYNVSRYESNQVNHADFGWFTFGILPFFVNGGAVDFPSDPSVKSPELDSNKTHANTHELRFQSTDPNARINWVVGAFLNDQTLRSHSDIDAGDWEKILPDAYAPGWDGVIRMPAFTGIPPYPCDLANLGACNPPWVYLYQDRYPIYLDTWGYDKEKAIFGQADINFTDSLQATIGLRYSDMSFQSILMSAGAVDGAPITENKTSKTNLLAPKVGLKWKFADDGMIYASAAKGGRNGGVNQTISDPACLNQLRDVWGMPNGVNKQYDPDSVWSYELGTKFQVRNKLVVDASVFQIDWDDMIRSVGIGGNTGCFFSFTANLGTARSRGGEIAVQYQALDNLMLSATAGTAKVESTTNLYVPDPNDPSGISHDANGHARYITRDGATLPGSNTSVNLAAQYSFTAFEKPMYARADFRYVASPSKGDAWDPNSAQYAGALNLFETPTLKTVNVRAGTKFHNWDVSLFINNLTNTLPIMKSRMGTVGDVNGAWMTGSLMTRPREMGVTAIYRY